MQREQGWIWYFFLRDRPPAGDTRGRQPPDRWVRGFAEVGTLLSTMTAAGELRGSAIGRLLANLPRVAPPGPDVHVLPHPSGWRTSTRALAGSVPLPGVSRLRCADRVLRHADRPTVHVHDNGSTAWAFDLPTARFHPRPQPGPVPGVLWEGTLLTYLTRNDALPVDSDKVLRRNPRLNSARGIVARGGVAPGTRPSRWLVVGSQGNRYTVDTTVDRLRSTCRWETEHAGSRGVCKHVLAVLVWLRDG